LLLAACAPIGRLEAPAAARVPCYQGDWPGDALRSCAPEILQESVAGPGATWDRPTLLDPDQSGSLADDARAVLERPPIGRVPVYTSVRTTEDRFYLLYLLYYPADWSGPASAPHLDHAGDVEGALVMVDRRTGVVDAVVTQAHGRYHLWQPAGGPLARSASGSFATGPSGRPLLFAEAGGHGLYALGHGDWRPRGGPRHAQGTSGAAAEPLPLMTDALRSADELRRWSRPGGLVGLPRGALPPWQWRDRAGRAGEPGLIIDDPARLLDLLLHAGPP
jgi:hypothetical protein